ncbi:hypothetical protein JKP22_00230 [Vibrio vulnificus]|uniref:hypothetical protein n=1 Tax=Vibrio vulnificus TaxID=672 RepID=UPI001CDBDC7A|nr:hypothetical protein [Vibrio vulnificus]MCA4011200.1 hypothetical protein [Vibrio vulnificus]MCU8147780.1 hypothetical protein [Vibrio vulnificus]
MKHFWGLPVLVAALSGCGGGGGGGSDGSNLAGDTGGKITLEQTSYSITTDGSNSHYWLDIPLNVTLPDSTQVIYLYVSSDKAESTNVSDVSLDLIGPAPHAGIVFNNVASQFSERLTLYFCYDQSCSKQVVGSPTDVQVKFDVTTPSISKSVNTSVEVTARRDAPTDTEYVIEIPVTGVSQNSSNLVSFTNQDGWSTTHCTYNDARDKAICNVKEDSFSSRTDAELNAGHRYTMELCGAMGCVDNVAIDVSYVATTIPTATYSDAKAVSYISSWPNKVKYSSYHNAIVVLSDLYDSPEINIVPVDGSPTITIPINNEADNETSDVFIDEATGEIIFVIGYGGNFYKDYFVTTVQPNLVTPGASVITSVPVAIDAIWGSHIALVGDTLFIQDHRLVYEVDITSGSILRQANFANASYLPLSMAASNESVYVRYDNGTLGENNRVLVERFTNNDLTSDPVKTLAYSPVEMDACKRMFSYDNVLYTSCGERIPTTIDTATDLAAQQTVPKPVWYTESNNAYRVLVGVVKLDNGNFLYAEESKESCYSDCLIYLTEATPNNEVITEYFAPTDLERFSGLMKADDGSVWLAGQKAGASAFLAKLVAP